MNQEIEVGSKWVDNSGEMLTIIHINSKKIVLEYEDLIIVDVINDDREFLKNNTPYIEPKPSLKVEAWVHSGGIIEYRTRGICSIDKDWTREPRLDYEVE